MSWNLLYLLIFGKTVDAADWQVGGGIILGACGPEEGGMLRFGISNSIQCTLIG